MVSDKNLVLFDILAVFEIVNIGESAGIGIFQSRLFLVCIIEYSIPTSICVFISMKNIENMTHSTARLPHFILAQHGNMLYQMSQTIAGPSALVIIRPHLEQNHGPSSFEHTNIIEKSALKFILIESP